MLEVRIKNQISKGAKKKMKKSIGPKTIVYPTPAWVIGSYDNDGKPNVMTAAWGGICSSEPPSVCAALRKNRYSYENIMAKKAFTVCVPSEEHVAATDYFGIVSGKTYDKFSDAGLTPVKSDLVEAPYVEEFPLVLECSLLKTIEIGIHTLFVGEIIDVKADEDVIGENGNPDINKVKPIIYSPGDNHYCGVGDFLGKAFSIGKKIKGLL